MIETSVLILETGINIPNSSPSIADAEYLNESIVSQGDELHPDEFGVNGRRLTIFTKSTVNKILFAKKKGKNVAVGVEYETAACEFCESFLCQF